jgi:hypothetical protein
VQRKRGKMGQYHTMRQERSSKALTNAVTIL